MSTLRTTTIDSPVGPLRAVGDGEALHGFYFPDHCPAPRVNGAVEDAGAFRDLGEQLAAWFAGERTELDLALELRGTRFQRRIWAALAEIPFGATVTYSYLAVAVGLPGAARAVGHAVARNPVSIVVPCHRVVGAAGQLTGYAGGLDRKRHLLDHEQAVLGARAVSTRK